LIRIANLSIAPDAPDYLPRAIARERCVLPLGLDGDALRVVLGRRSDYREVIAILRFILDRPRIVFGADHERIARAVDELYGNRSTNIENCPLDFRFECPRQWLSLRPTGSADVRFCETCQRNVFLCRNNDEAIVHARSGRCVAIRRYDEDDDGSMMGSLLVTVHAPSGRSDGFGDWA
jgi:hypothetical protein